MSELLTPSQAAERMDITVKTVYQYLNKGQLEGAFKDDRGRWQIPDSALLAQGKPIPPTVEEVTSDSLEQASPPAPPPTINPIEPTESTDETPVAPSEVALPAPVEETPSSAASGELTPPEELTPEERAARRERERAAALAALYAQQELDEVTPPGGIREQEEPAAKEDEDFAGKELSGEQNEGQAHTQDSEGDQVEVTGAAVLAALQAQQEFERQQEADEILVPASLDEDVQAETEAAPAPDVPDEAAIGAETDGSVQPDEYVMDFVPVDAQAEQVGAAAPHAVEIDSDAMEAGDTDLSDVDLSAVDLAALAAAKEQEAPSEGEEAIATETAKRSGVGCPVLIAIAATIVVLLVAGAFIANQSLGIWDRTAKEAPEEATPLVIAPSDDASSAEEGASTQAETEAAIPDQAIQPKAEGESLIIVPAIAGGDAAANAALRDAIRVQASALGLANLRAEADPSSVAANQLSQAVDLGAQYQADMVMWGEDLGDGTVVNLLSLKSAGLPVAEAEVAGVTPAERVQPLGPNAYASFALEDTPAHLAFLAGVAVGQSSALSGDYEQATAALQQAVDSLDPQAALPTGLDEALFRLGWLYQTQQVDLQSALDAYTQALQLNLDHVSALNNIGIVFDDLGDKQQALFYYNQALPLLREAKNVTAEIQILNRIGALYNEVGDVQQALSFYNRSLPLTMEAGDIASEALTRRKIAMIHKDLGELDIAEEEMAKVLAIVEAAGISSLEQDQQALEEIQALRAEQTPEMPVFRQRNR